MPHSITYATDETHLGPAGPAGGAGRGHGPALRRSAGVARREARRHLATVCGVDLHRAFDPIDRLRGVVRILWRELAKFGVVGAAAFIIDFGGFNLLFYGPLAGHLTTSKVVSGGLATLFAWAGNRLWTFRHRRNRPVHHEAMLFFAVNGLGLLLSTGYLNAAHDLLGWTSRVAVSVNTVIGIGLATLWRFYAYRKFVFAPEIANDVSQETEESVEQLVHGGFRSGAASAPSLWFGSRAR